MHHHDSGVLGAGPDVAANTYAHLQLPHISAVCSAVCIADLHTERSSDVELTNHPADFRTHLGHPDRYSHPSPNLRCDTGAVVQPDSPPNDASAVQCSADKDGMLSPHQL